MSYRDWEDEPRSRRGRHSAPDGWVAGDETYAGQPRRRDPFRGDPLGDSSTDLGRPTRSSRHAPEPAADPRGWSAPDRLDDTGAWTRGAHTGEWQRPDDWDTRPASAPPDDYTAETWREAPPWSGAGGGTGYGRRRAPEPTGYDRPALPSAESSPAAPTSSGAYVGEVLPRGYGGPRPDPDDGYGEPRSYRVDRYAGPEPPRWGRSERDEPGRYRDEPSSYRGEPSSYRGEPSSYRGEPSSYRDEPAGYREVGRRRYRDEPTDYGEPSPRRRRPTYREDPPEEPSATPGSPSRPGWDGPGEASAPRRRRPTYREDPPDRPEPPAPRYRDEPTGYADPTPSYRREAPGYRAPAPSQRDREPSGYGDDPPAYPRQASRPSYRDPAPPSYRDPAPPSYRDPAPGGRRDEPRPPNYREPGYREPAAPGYPDDATTPIRRQAAPTAPSYRQPTAPTAPAGPPATPTAPSYRQPAAPTYRDRPAYPEQRTSPPPDQPTRYRARAAAYREEPPTTVFDRPTYRGGGATAAGSANDGPVAAYRSGGSAYPDAPSRRPTAPAQRRAPAYDVDEDDEVDEEPVPGGYLASAVYTVMWFAVPMVLWVLWSLTLSGQASANCVDGAGTPCASERVEALSTLTDNLPRMLGTMLFSLVIAVVLRWVSSSWKAATVGFAAAVVGGGLATVGISVITGQPIG